MKTVVHCDEASAQDRLNRHQYTEIFARLAEECETPFVVGLYGEWGVGKTTLMRHIEKKLDSAKTRSVWFDPWMHQFNESPALSLLHTVVNELGMDAESRKLLTVLVGALGSVLLKTTTTLNLKDIDELGKRYEEELFRVQETQVRLQKYFADLIQIAQGKPKRRIVFFIDDLDRCMPEHILKVLEALKLYLNLPGCVYFLGVDRHALEKSIHFHYKDLDLSEVSYLDKIVQLPFEIPPIAPESMGEYVGSLLTDELKVCEQLLIAGLGDNPRQIKRFINTLALNHQLAVRLGIPQYDPKMLAVLLLIQQRSPGLYNLFAANAKQQDFFMKLKLAKEETKVYYDKYVAADDRLKEILYLVDTPNNVPLEQYIYLTEVAGVQQAPESTPNSNYPKLEGVLSLHNHWLETGGREGQQAVMHGGVLSEAVLCGANLSRADLRTSDLTRANLSGAGLSETILRDAVLHGANLDETDLSKADMRGTYLIGANLSHADLRGAKLVAAYLNGAILRHANLYGADLRDTDLRGSDLQGVLGLTADQLLAAKTDDATILPDGSNGPFKRGSKGYLSSRNRPAAKRKVPVNREQPLPGN